MKYQDNNNSFIPGTATYAQKRIKHTLKVKPQKNEYSGNFLQIDVCTHWTLKQLDIWENLLKQKCLIWESSRL